MLYDQFSKNIGMTHVIISADGFRTLEKLWFCNVTLTFLEMDDFTECSAHALAC